MKDLISLGSEVTSHHNIDVEIKGRIIQTYLRKLYEIADENNMTKGKQLIEAKGETLWSKLKHGEVR